MDPADLTAMSVEVVTFVEEVGACRFTDSLTVDDLVADIATIFTGRHPLLTLCR